jgi:thiol-disulfide isomerase/thioredoxin
LLKTKHRSTAFALTCLMAAALAGCDTGEAGGAQGEDEVSSETGAEEFTGTVARDFAGSAIPEVLLTNPAGETLALAQTGDMPVLLNLWATWCAPCIAEMPLLNELAADPDIGVRVVTVSEDITGAEAVVPFFQQNDLADLPQWMDQNNDLAFAFGGGSVLPLTVLYDAQGKEVWRVMGAFDWGSQEARTLIAEATGG